MIKILEHLSNTTVNPQKYLETQADNYWNSLNPQTAGIYSEKSLISVVRKYREKSKNLDQEYLGKYARKSAKIAGEQCAFFDFLLSDNEKNLKLIIVSAPDELNLMRLEIIKNSPANLFCTNGVKGRKKNKFGALISEEIFNYTKYRSSKFCIDLLDKITQPTTYCPYCGELPIKVVPVDPGAQKVSKRALLDLDHFFSKVTHPYFSTSIFNLIPCCGICNSRYKGAKQFDLATHINPYSDSFDSYFQFELSTDISGKRIVEIKEKSAAGKMNAVVDFGLPGRYIADHKLLELEREYRGLKRHDSRELSWGVRMILKDVPLDSRKILAEYHGKAKRDILKFLDMADKVFNNHLF
ncbi:hypothetical protein [Janthinobacterium lividum]|uniref:hypothetical protein n=1 Tax=Janthinobacterium lividum TaxID=29581 RepID=UPI0011130978|nr:hypothetical protein [Janthinobacterium lividum]MCC7716924.1 hypothetical protein [Janthinobacterium lividum]WQE31872.1 hypothetical protein U0004_28620 [Janthinobacterium lividum]